MKKIWATMEEQKAIEAATAYLSGKVGVYPDMMRIVLKDPVLTIIARKLRENSPLLPEECEILAYQYVFLRKNYEVICKYLGLWGKLNSDQLFFDSLGTDVSLSLCQMTLDGLLSSLSILERFEKDTPEMIRQHLVASILEMSEDEFEAYREMQKSQF